MENFVKALDRNGSGFFFLCEKFKRKTMEKFKAALFDGPEIREIMKDASFDESLNCIQFSARLVLMSIIVNFLANHRSSEYQKLVDELIENFQKLGAACSENSLSSFTSSLLP